jgi:hypothetical protein
MKNQEMYDAVMDGAIDPYYECISKMEEALGQQNKERHFSYIEVAILIYFLLGH